jgi:phage repressor protein C with HTH and peptisase S24 domain
MHFPGAEVQMPKDTREPQSYGSDADWVTGKTGQKVNDQAGTPATEHQEFYDERREQEHSTEHQGGKISDVQLAESAAQPTGPATGEIDPSTKVSAEESGAKRDSFFKQRDYD